MVTRMNFLMASTMVTLWWTNVDFPMKNGGSFHCYVSSLEGTAIRYGHHPIPGRDLLSAKLLRSSFDRLDENGDGFVSRAELQRLLERAGSKLAQAQCHGRWRWGWGWHGVRYMYMVWYRYIHIFKLIMHKYIYIYRVSLIYIYNI